MGQQAAWLTVVARVCDFSRALTLAWALVVASLVGAGYASQAVAQDQIVVTEVVVKGNQRIEAETVRSYTLIKPGSFYSPELADQSLKQLFGTGLFADISMHLEGTKLVVSVVENPIINRVAFEGNSAIKEEDLQNEVQLQPRVIYTRAKVQSDVSRMVELYRRGGRFSATIEPKVIQLPQNRVDLVYEISEGPKTKIASINFIGNKEFSDGTLREVISTGESAWWKFLSSSDSYDPDRLTYDRELLRRYYLQRGYADFRVVSAVADLSRDDSAFHITFTVDEGEVYQFGDIKVVTELDKLNQEELEALLLPKKGDTYNAGLIDETIDELTYAAGSQGYAFAEVRPRVKRRKDERVIDLTFQITEGPRVYVERINITGNSRTLDKVIRRQMRMSEGDAFNNVLLDKSEKNIRALQYFSKVDVTQSPGSAPDKTIIGVDVQEQSTGSLSLSAGFSTLDNAVAGIQLSERNFLGRGLQLSTSLSLSKRRQLIEFHYTDRYFLDRDLVGGIDIFGSETDYQDESSFNSRSQGFGLRFGFPLSEKSRLLTRYQFRFDEIFDVRYISCGDPAYVPGDYCVSPIIKDAEGTEYRSIVGYDYYYDNRNDPVEPTGGWDFLFTQNFAGLGGTVRYISNEILARYYFPLSDDFLTSWRVDGGYVHGIGDDVPLNDHFFKGGNTIRGFARGGIGPRDLTSTNSDAVGATAYIFGTAELSFPNGLPDALGIKTSVFADGGYIGLSDYDNTLYPGIVDDFAPRASVGLSLYWQSPFGPIRLDFAQVLLDEPYDEKEAFRFSAGTSF
ncbi:outer membrane protein assembly factor BamA [Parvibaculum sp.]|jgi:outer membrane protein insertion porin family|uniref:outer membrane protein assembly factor BamA n=1 Tax=Parvibaculum sp. TaxID=2024848 RepID=UPI000C681C01|nr:outer membrane protein assembly factor BamA [Parvibaculum sp.]MAM93496.1 outer membrane protein assembly factor BamA [Parvibaculum sp.]|tara:strand:- start:4738 stop:7119 length:2382 start_codon:yes stop_codon:yes gene_type:complete